MEGKMCEVSKTVKDVVNKLRNNPVFYMSLGSKELFHSNMLAFMLENEWINGLEELFAPYNGKEKLNNYKVLTVLREKSHFDLIIVFLPSNDYDATIKNYDQRQIADIFQNSGPKDELLLSTLKNNCKFVVVENKLKSIPDKTQLEKYDEAIQNRIWLRVFKVAKKNDAIVLDTTNSTRYLMAPEVAFKEFRECPEWKHVHYEDILRKLQAQGEDKNPFKAKFIEHYAAFLENMLELTKDIEEKLDSPSNLAFPKQLDIAELSKIRIHDFYEKLWFSVLLSKIETVENVKKGSGYSNSSGLVEFQIKNDHHVVYGVQIQQSQFRLFVVPTGKCKREYSDEEIKDCCYGVLEIMKEKLGTSMDFSPKKKNPKDLHCYGEFKYKFIPLEKDISIEKLTEMINCALDAISQSPLKNLTAKAEEEK